MPVRIRWYVNLKFMAVKPSGSNELYSVIGSIFLVISLPYIFSFQLAHADSGYPSIPVQNFSKFTCVAGVGSVILTGYIINGDTAFRIIFLKMFVLDSQGNVIAVGYGNISDVKPHETAPFDAIARFNGNFSSCTIQIDNAIPK